MVFSSGVHPAENKISQTMETKSMPNPQQLIIPLLQHIGAPCEPTVKAGDEVKAWQKIADSNALISAPIHTPFPGKIKAIKKSTTPTGAVCEALVLEKTSDKKPSPKKKKYDSLEPKQLIEEIRNAGIVGMGGAGFPTHVKLSPPKDKEIDTLILNGAECEPYLTADHRLMLESPQEILEGIKIIEKILKPKKTLIAVENNKLDAIDMLRGLGAEVLGLKTLYPQGAEKTLIKTATGRTVPSGGLPMDVGVVVQNVATAKAIHDALAYGKPLVDRTVTVSGDAIEQPANLTIPFGTTYSQITDFLGFDGDYEKIISGGPMMGIAQPHLDIPIIKTTSGILFLGKQDEQEQKPCIRCAKCIEVCPQNLMPNVLYKLVDDVRTAETLNYNLLDCVECGCCAFTCPSKIDHVQYMKLGKKRARKLIQKQKEEKKDA
ncbi:MAG: electron transport complex subunit RsxC [Candidatus Altiarchaeales archaeon]|nr:electron transport complex subunit RsxC [Candidatus Altiarchaeales archaeon]